MQWTALALSIQRKSQTIEATEGCDVPWIQAPILVVAPAVALALRAALWRRLLPLRDQSCHSVADGLSELAQGAFGDSCCLTCKQRMSRVVSCMVVMQVWSARIGAPTLTGQGEGCLTDPRVEL